jgi:hypothetical protein
MSKLFKLKKWLTLEDAASHLSNLLSEPVGASDVLRLALDSELTISVNFVNHAKGRRGQIVEFDKDRLLKGMSAGEIPIIPLDKNYEFLDRFTKLDEPSQTETFEALPEELKRHLFGQLCDGDEYQTGRYLVWDKKIETLSGIWDLPMIGAERLDVEHQYQRLTGGPAVNLICFGGTLVQSLDGVIYQIQENIDDNEFQDGSRAQLKEIEKSIENEGLDGEAARKLLEKHGSARTDFLKEQHRKPDYMRYYPAQTLPQDSTFAIRTEALTELQERLSQDQSEQPINLRKETTYLNIIGGLLHLMLEKTPTGKPRSSYKNQSAIITDLLDRFEGRDGISQRNLDKKFGEANKLIGS